MKYFDSKMWRQSVDCRPDGHLRQAEWPTGNRVRPPRVRHAPWLACRCCPVSSALKTRPPASSVTPPRPLSLLQLAAAAAKAQPLRLRCRASSAAAELAHHHKNASASSFVASPCSSPPPPPLIRVVWGLVRAYSPFPPPPPWRDLAKVGAPRGQLPPRPSHPLLCAWLAW